MSVFSAIQHHKWANLKGERLSDVIHRRTVTGAKGQVSQFTLKAGAVVPLHGHENEQITFVFSGALRFVYGDNGGDSRTLRPGEILVTPPNLLHMVEVLEDSVAIDIFMPPRDDWTDGGDSYLRGGKKA